MAGLFEKDLRIILQRKQTLLLFALVAAFVGYSMDGSFVIGFISIISVTLAIGTIAYDELDNGMAYLMAMPVDRKTYVKEKYLFSIVVSVIGWLAAVIIYIAVGFAKGTGMLPTDGLIEGLLFLPIIFIFISIMLPLDIIFGSQKSRIAMFIIVGFCCAVVVFTQKVFNMEQSAIESIINGIAASPLYVTIGAVALATIIIAAVSYMISQRGMAKKEF